MIRLREGARAECVRQTRQDPIRRVGCCEECPCLFTHWDSTVQHDHRYRCQLLGTAIKSPQRYMPTNCPLEDYKP